MQSQSVWQQLSLRLRTRPGIAGLLLSLTVACLLAWQYQSSMAPKLEPLYDGERRSGEQLTKMMAALADSELTGHRLRDGQLWVPAGKEPKYYAALLKAGAMPAGLSENSQSALEKGSLFESDRDVMRRMNLARERDLAIAIKAMPGIEDAMVQYDQAARAGFRSEPILTASVLVMPSDGCRLQIHQVDTIIQLVASAKAGLKPEQIVVTDLRSQLAYRGPFDGETIRVTPHVKLEWKSSVESRWEEKIRRALQHIPRLAVTVDAKLAADERQWQDVELLAIAIGVPEAHYDQVQRETLAKSNGVSQAQSIDEIQRQIDQRIRAAVTLLVEGKTPSPTAVEGTDRPQFPLKRDSLQCSIAVVPYREVAAASETSNAVGTGSLAERWGQTWQHHRVAILGVIAGGLFVGWATRRRTAGEIDDRKSTLSLEDFRDANTSLDPVSAKHGAAEVDPEQLRETLAGVVRSNPEAAAEVLHRWIDQAG